MNVAQNSLVVSGKGGTSSSCGRIPVVFSTCS